MKKSRSTEEQIIAILSEQKRGMATAKICWRHGVSQGTFYKWKAKFGGMDASGARKQSSATTSYVGKIVLFRSAGHGASERSDALIWLPRRVLPSRSGLSHSKHRVRTEYEMLGVDGFAQRYMKPKLRGNYDGNRSTMEGAATARERFVCKFLNC